MEFTNLEIKVIQLIADEKTNKVIAKDLNYSQRNIEYVISNLCRKLEVNTRVGIIAESYKRNLISF
ncbi:MULTISPECIES: response regulator transcription factor [Bacillus amyloliquefaciens group]|nr:MULTISPECIES: LuxR C-terminal-related transcriptional regulator [Bacillus amyloliquefaciens group]